MSRTRTPRQWREILAAFDRSDFSQAEFCRRRGLALATVPEVAEVPQLVEIFSEPGPRTSEALRLELDLPLGPVTVHGQPGSLAELLRLLASGPNDVRP